MIENNRYTSVHMKLFLFKQVHEKHLKSVRPPCHLLGHVQKASSIYGSRTTNSFSSEGDSLGLWQSGDGSKKLLLKYSCLNWSSWSLQLFRNGPSSFWNSVSKASTLTLLKICGRCSKAILCPKTGLKWTQMNLSFNQLLERVYVSVWCCVD